MAFSEPSKSGREAEAVLMVVAGDPAALVAEVTGLDSVAGLGLGPAQTLQADDSYFDSPDNALTGRGLALRLRRLPDQTLIGLKGEEMWTEKGVLRLELEAPWSSNSLADVLHELGFREVRLTWPGTAINGADPQDVLASMGLVPFQTRHLTRLARPVNDGDDAVAELALDTVTQQVDGTRFTYREIEVEAADAADTAAATNVAEALLGDYPNGLRTWSHSKLATGMALERLARSGRLEGLASGGELTPTAIEALFAALGED
jgi:inorganic triphosphatase YgiF